MQEGSTISHPFNDVFQFEGRYQQEFSDIGKASSARAAYSLVIFLFVPIVSKKSVPEILSCSCLGEH